MFYHACRAGGCSIRDSIVLFLGVRVGAIWPFVTQWAYAPTVLASGPRLAFSSSELRMQAGFRQAGELVLADNETDDSDVIDARVDAPLSMMTVLDTRRI